MIETLISLQIGIELFTLSILFFIATKIAVINHNSDQILNEIRRLYQ